MKKYRMAIDITATFEASDAMLATCKQRLTSIKRLLNNLNISYEYIRIKEIPNEATK